MAKLRINTIYDGGQEGSIANMVESLKQSIESMQQQSFMRGVSGESVKSKVITFEEILKVASVFDAQGKPVTSINGKIDRIFSIDGVQHNEWRITNTNSLIGLNKDWWYNAVKAMTFTVFYTGENTITNTPFLVFIDPRLEQIKEYVHSGNCQFNDKSCVIAIRGNITDGDDVKIEMSAIFPRLYYNDGARAFCWEINGEKTSISAQGIAGKDGVSAEIREVSAIYKYKNPTSGTTSKRVYNIETSANNDTIIVLSYRYDDKEYSCFDSNRTPYMDNMTDGTMCIVKILGLTTPGPVNVGGYNNGTLYNESGNVINNIDTADITFGVAKKNESDKTIEIVTNNIRFRNFIKGIAGKAVFDNIEPVNYGSGLIEDTNNANTISFKTGVDDSYNNIISSLSYDNTSSLSFVYGKRVQKQYNKANKKDYYDAITITKPNEKQEYIAQHIPLDIVNYEVNIIDKTKERKVVIDGSDIAFIPDIGGYAQGCYVKNSEGKNAGTIAAAYGKGDVLEYTYYGGGWQNPHMVIKPHKISDKEDTYEGLVGIGTKDPVTKLHIVGTTDTAPSTHGLLVLGDTNTYNISMDQNEIMARNNGKGSILYLNAEGGDTIICETSGNVGIGKKPSNKLDVKGSVNCDELKITRVSDNASAFAIYNLASDGKTSGSGYRFAATGGSSYFTFYTHDGATYADRVTINKDGRLQLNASTGTSTGGGLEVGKCKILQLDSGGQSTMITLTDQWRFGKSGAGWNWNQWAGLKYDDTANKIYLGIADGSVFAANNPPKTGGTLQLVNCGLNTDGGITVGGNINANGGITLQGYRQWLEIKDKAFTRYVFPTSKKIDNKENPRLDVMPITLKIQLKDCVADRYTATLTFSGPKWDKDRTITAKQTTAGFSYQEDDIDFEKSLVKFHLYGNDNNDNSFRIEPITFDNMYDRTTDSTAYLDLLTRTQIISIRRIDYPVPTNGIQNVRFITKTINNVRGVHIVVPNMEENALNGMIFEVYMLVYGTY